MAIGKGLEEDDYRSLVSEYPNSLECPICLQLMKDPHIVSCCGKKFCEPCLKRLPNERCPICKEPFTSMIEKELQRQILNLKVNCNVQECDWVGETRDIERHLNTDCKYYEIDCRLKCGLKLQRKDMAHHEVHVCTMRSIEAKMTSIVLKLEKTVSSLEETCTRQSKQIQELQTALCSVRTNTLLPRFSITTSPMNEYWYSPMFYSHHKGYELQLKCTTTYPVWMGKYNVKCQLQLINGEYDNLLQWPIDIEAILEVTARHRCDGEIIRIKLVIHTFGKAAANKGGIIAESQSESLVTNFHQNRAIVGVAFYFAEITFISITVKPCQSLQIQLNNSI